MFINKQVLLFSIAIVLITLIIEAQCQEEAKPEGAPSERCEKAYKKMRGLVKPDLAKQPESYRERVMCHVLSVALSARDCGLDIYNVMDDLKNRGMHRNNVFELKRIFFHNDPKQMHDVCHYFWAQGSG